MTWAQSPKALSVSPDLELQSANAAVQILRDPRAEFDFEAVSSGRHAAAENSIDVGGARIGYIRGALWLRLSIDNPSDQAIQRWLVLQRGGKYRIEAQLERNGLHQHWRLNGLDDPIRAPRSRHGQLHIEFPPHSRTEITLRLRAVTSVMIDVSLQSDAALSAQEWKSQWLFGVLAGFSAAIVLFLALIGLLSRETSFLWFAITASGSVGYQLFFEGYVAFLGLDLVDGWARSMTIWMGALAAGAFVRLCRNLSHSRQHLPRFDRWVLRPFEATSLLLAAFGTVFPWPGAPIAAIWFIPATYSAIAALVVAALRRRVKLTLFVIATAAYLAVTTGFQLYLLGLEQEVPAMRSLRLMLLCATLLGFAVAVSERARQAREELRAAVERNERRLADMVEERTHELAQAKDAAERSLHELELTQATLVEREKLAALGGLVAGVAHEINTPVGVAVTSASSLVESVREFEAQASSGRLTRSALAQFTERVNEACQLVLRNLERASALVRSFKQVAVDQVVQGKRSLELGEYCRSVLITLAPLLKPGRHRVELDCPHPVEVEADAGALAQIITNLIQNAVVHGFEGREQGQIRIRISTNNNKVELVVEDDGAGMNADTAKRVFEPFFTTRRGQGGTGLGMHVVYNLVTVSLGGEIDIASEPGRGTRVRLRFPCRSPRL